MTDTTTEPKPPEGAEPAAAPKPDKAAKAPKPDKDLLPPETPTRHWAG